jgi:hypothetical protein
MDRIVGSQQLPSFPQPPLYLCRRCAELWLAAFCSYVQLRFYGGLPRKAPAKLSEGQQHKNPAQRHLGRKLLLIRPWSSAMTF